MLETMKKTADMYEVLEVNDFNFRLQTSSDSPLPVMVWIHGGGFAYGHADADVYGPEFLMNKSVILVTVNYRIGILGKRILEFIFTFDISLRDVWCLS